MTFPLGMAKEMTRKMGTPYLCNLLACVRTFILEIPGYQSCEGHLITPAFVSNSDEFKVAIVTDPRVYFEGFNILDNQELVEKVLRSLPESSHPDADDTWTTIYAVIQHMQGLGSFPAVDGQCATFIDSGDGIEKTMIFDCGEEYVPQIEDRTQDINMALAAIKVAFTITEAFKPIYNEVHYIADTGQCMGLQRMEMRINPTSVGPLSLEALSGQAEQSGELLNRLGDGITNNNIGNPRNRTQSIGAKLDELVEALQLNPSTDDAYLRLWYVRMWERLYDFGQEFRPRLELINNDRLGVDLAEEKSHRDDIAHYDVDRIDMDRLREIQKKTFHILKERL